jgi:SAM-dependent methyltransferase
MSLRDAWEQAAPEWITWARKPGHDSYWRFHREQFLSLVPPSGELTVDIGCGEGRVARDLAALGHRVLAIDGSMAMARAAADHPGTHGPVVIADAARLPIREAAADLAVAFMSLQDVDDFDFAIAEAARVLRSDGVFLMAIVHPVNSMGHFEDRGDGAPERFVMNGSWFERHPNADRCERAGLGMTFHSEHRPLEDYTEALYDAGFLIEQLREPTETDLDNHWHRMPLFLHIRAIKRATTDTPRAPGSW